jgi:hypothetical protein
MSIVVRGSMDPVIFAEPAREAVRQLNADVPMYAIQTMTEKLEQSLWTRQAYSWLFGAFAVIVILLPAAAFAAWFRTPSASARRRSEFA